jgi:hypothetical protein
VRPAHNGGCCCINHSPLVPPFLRGTSGGAVCGAGVAPITAHRSRICWRVTLRRDRAAAELPLNKGGCRGLSAGSGSRRTPPKQRGMQGVVSTSIINHEDMKALRCGHGARRGCWFLRCQPITDHRSPITAACATGIRRAGHKPWLQRLVSAQARLSPNVDAAARRVCGKDG